jgi:hypothetical protein
MKLGSLAGYTQAMDKRSRMGDRVTVWKRRLHRTRLECRECEVICERVVSPQHCLLSGCSGVYVFEDEDGKMFGCVHKVFSPELDLAAFTERRGRAKGVDSYGAIKLNRAPRRQCKVTVEQGYPAAAARTYCTNPTFFHQPAGGPEESMKLTSNLPADPQPQD